MNKKWCIYWLCLEAHLALLKRKGITRRRDDKSDAKFHHILFIELDKPFRGSQKRIFLLTTQHRLYLRPQLCFLYTYRMCETKNKAISYNPRLLNTSTFVELNDNASRQLTVSWCVEWETYSARPSVANVELITKLRQKSCIVTKTVQSKVKPKINLKLVKLYKSKQL